MYLGCYPWITVPFLQCTSPHSHSLIPRPMRLWFYRSVSWYKVCYSSSKCSLLPRRDLNEWFLAFQERFSTLQWGLESKSRKTTGYGRLDQKRCLQNFDIHVSLTNYIQPSSTSTCHSCDSAQRCCCSDHGIEARGNTCLIGRAEQQKEVWVAEGAGEEMEGGTKRWYTLKATMHVHTV